MAEVQKIIEALLQQQQQQTQLLLAQMQQQHAQMHEIMLKSSGRESLVDSRGVAKPDRLDNKTAGDHGSFKTWRIKFQNWICAAMPAAHDVLQMLETHSNDEVTETAYQEILAKNPVAERLGAQLYATLVSHCVDEPLAIVINGPKGIHNGLEALRRINNRYDPVGPRSAKVILQKLMATGSVKTERLRTEIERVEKAFEEYRTRADNALGEDLRMVIIEQLLMDPIKTHVSLNSDRLDTYETLRSEIMKYAEHMYQRQVGPSGAKEAWSQGRQD